MKASSLGIWLLSATITSTMAAQLFVASYAGTITTLKFSGSSSSGYSLEIVEQTKAVSPNPSWLALDKRRNILYATEPGVNGPNGTLNSLAISSNGSLSLIDSIATPQGAAYAGLYGRGQAIGAAYYTSGYVGTVNTVDPSHLTNIQTETFPVPVPGPYPVQNMSHPHDFIPDPTGKFVLVPDLGADLVAPLVLSPGSTPRHGVFVLLDGKWYFYILCQNVNVLLGFTISYTARGTLSFSQFSSTNLLLRPDGSLAKAYPSTQASELHVSPDNKFLIASLRGDASYNISSPLNHSSTIPSDSLLTYAVGSSGALTLVDDVPAGGSSPRQFALNAAGDKVAVGVQNNGWVIIFNRDTKSGKIGSQLAVVGGLGAGGVVCTIWNECIPED